MSFPTSQLLNSYQLSFHSWKKRCLFSNFRLLMYYKSFGSLVLLDFLAVWNARTGQVKVKHQSLFRSFLPLSTYLPKLQSWIFSNSATWIFLLFFELWNTINWTECHWMGNKVCLHSFDQDVLFRHFITL